MNKRGQAALEFLMTYGWAILVVMVVIGALAYFGVLNPMMFVPERCTMQTGISCDEAYRINGSEVLIRFENNFGKDVTVTNISATYNPGATNEVVCYIDPEDYDPIGEGNVTFNSGRIIQVALNSTDCDLISQEGRKIRMDLRIDYFPTGAGEEFSSVFDGSILAKVQDN
jgi:uncharacterized protein (UPF0333 family)